MGIHMDWLNIQLNNSGILGELSMIKLLQLQMFYWTHNIPFDFIKCLPHLKFGNRLIESAIYINKDLPITWHLNETNSCQIQGGTRSLANIIPIRDYLKSLKTIRKHRIMFLEQIVSPDMKLLCWSEIKRIYNITCNTPPIWYRQLI